MHAQTVRIVRGPVSRADLAAIAATKFGDMVEAVVGVERGIMAIAGELHTDEETGLLDDGVVSSLVTDA